MENDFKLTRGGRPSVSCPDKVWYYQHPHDDIYV